MDGKDSGPKVSMKTRFGKKNVRKDGTLGKVPSLFAPASHACPPLTSLLLRDAECPLDRVPDVSSCSSTFDRSPVSGHLTAH